MRNNKYESENTNISDTLLNLCNINYKEMSTLYAFQIQHYSTYVPSNTSF